MRHHRFCLSFSSNLGALWVCRDTFCDWSKSLTLYCHIFPALCAGVTMFSLRCDWQVKWCFFFQNRAQARSFTGDVFEGGISFANNLSLRLICFLFCAGAGEMYYYVVLNGFHITEQKITSYTKNDKVCWRSAILSTIVDDPLALRWTVEITASSNIYHLCSHQRSGKKNKPDWWVVFLVLEAYDVNTKAGAHYPEPSSPIQALRVNPFWWKVIYRNSFRAKFVTP